ncbi:MAG: hydantoinase/oxoprolinase family protein, partial [Gracilibacteraceae bacterium]|nr:hydantoinase/oxoprolinase family protein [Gracilibacteraceae bacterium]
MSIGIGIDTGGTYTDAVAYDFTAEKIIGAAKALTTPRDLSAGVLRALDGLPGDALRQADTLALSTTLATNA